MYVPKLKQKQVVFILGGAVLVAAISVLMYFGLRPKATNPATATKLTVWGTEDGAAIRGLLAAYPYATVSYRQLTAAGYENAVIAALAAGTGPDVLEIGNRDLPKFASILAPLPTSTQAFTSAQLSQTFPDVVAQDFTSKGELYGLPLYLDTLAMVYNKDLFNTAGIVAPPKTWDDFDADVAKLRSVGANGQVMRAGAAIGGSSNSIQNASDILALLMLQNGAQMTDAENNAATFASPSGNGAGLAAFNFYLQFANPNSPYYTWSDAFPGGGTAFDSFAAGKTAIVFAYQSDLAAIEAKAPFLHIGVAPMPQPKGATIDINYPRYAGFAATKAGDQVASWNFILYFGALSTDAQTFVAQTGKPPALRTGIAADLTDPNLAVFAKQALSARSWYDPDAVRVDVIFSNAIRNVLTGSEDPTHALNEAQTAVSQLIP